MKTKWRAWQRSPQNTWLQVDYLCTDGFNLEILRRYDIRCLRAEFTAKHEKAPLSLTTRWWMEPDLGSWQSPDISRSHLYRGTIAWAPPTAIYRAYTVYGTTWSYCETVILWNSHTVKQSRWRFCLIQIKHYSTRGPFHFGCAFPMCTGVVMFVVYVVCSSWSVCGYSFIVCIPQCTSCTRDNKGIWIWIWCRVCETVPEEYWNKPGTVSQSQCTPPQCK